MPGLETKNEMRGETPGATTPGSSPLNSFSTNALDLKKPSVQVQVSKEMEQTLLDIVMDDYDTAKSDRGKRKYGITSKGEDLNFDEWFKRIIDMYNGDRIPKTIPWKFCSNRSLRIGTAILDLLHARLFPAVWNEDLTRWRAGNYVDVPKAERISKFMDWWIRVHNPLRPFYDSWVKYTIGLGDALTETYWDVEEVATNQEMQIPIQDEQGQPMTNQDGTPAIMKQMKVDRIEKTKSRVILKDKVFMMANARDVQRDPVIIEEEFAFKDLEDLEKRDVCINVSDELRKEMLTPEPTGQLSDDEKERLKKIKIRNMPVKVIREYLHYDVDGTGVAESIRVMVSPEHRIYLGAVRMRDLTKSGKRPIDFTKYDNYLGRPDDLDGEGILHKVRELAEEVDACFNQLTDAHTLAVLRPFFYDPSGDVDAPAVNLGPNKGIPITDPQRNIYFPEIGIATERLINAIRLVMEFVERLTAASEYVMGKESETVGGSGTATRTQAIVQAAEVRFTLPSERLRFGAARILNQHLDLLQLNIPQGMEEKVLGEKGDKVFQTGELTDDGISGEFIAYLMADPSMGSKSQERQMMSQIYQALLGNPIVASNPQNLYYLTADTLKAYGRDEGYIQKWLGPPPMQDDITDPEDENTLMLQGDYQRVVPQMTENHIYHIMKHQELPNSPNFQALMQAAPSLTQQILAYDEQHIQQHMQMMQMMMAMQQAAQKQGGKGGPFGGGQAGTEETGGQPGMGASESPMGQAQATQRTGKSQQPQGA